MYPWRRVFKSLFAHDRSWGHVSTLRQLDAKGCPVEVTKLGIRLAATCGQDWRQWQRSLAALLEVLEDEMPVLPPEQAQADDKVSHLLPHGHKHCLVPIQALLGGNGHAAIIGAGASCQGGA